MREKSSDVSDWVLEGTLSRSISVGSRATEGAASAGTAGVRGAGLRLTVESGVVAMTRISGNWVVSSCANAGAVSAATPAANAIRSSRTAET